MRPTGRAAIPIARRGIHELRSGIDGDPDDETNA